MLLRLYGIAFKYLFFPFGRNYYLGESALIGYFAH